MTKILLDSNEVRSILWEESDKYEFVEQAEWTDDGKYQLSEVVFKDTESGKFYQMQLSRSGSYHTDWYYSYEDCKTEACEVKLVTKTIVTNVWEIVK